MPHVTRRHKPKRKKPKRRTPMGLAPEALQIHRELTALRIAGGARPGRHRDKLLEERFEKLGKVDSTPQAGTDPAVPELSDSIQRLAQHYTKRRGY